MLFPQEYLRAALLVSLLSVWMLVGLFCYLNSYTRREYFTIWTAAWLFYALWLTLSLTQQNSAPDSIVFILQQCCVGISSVFLLWGSLRFLGIAVRQTLFGLFMLFLVVWSSVSPQLLSSALQIQLPVFLLIGMGSMFAGSCFYRQRKKMPYVGAGMLSAGFLLWGAYLASYPISQEYKDLYSTGFFIAAVLQLFIAVSMIVLVLEEVRHNAEQVRAEIAAVRSEKEVLQLKVITTEETCRNLYDQARLTEGVQTAYDELRRTQQVVVQQERLRALGQMASGIAHDVNNALCPIVAYADLLVTTMPDLPDKQREYLTTIKRSGEDIASIVARMREFYRRRDDREQLTKVNVNQIVDEVIELTRPRWRDVSQRDGISIHVSSELSPDLPKLLSDPSELREALINLIFNSVDALPHGGNITLVTRPSAVPAAKVNGHEQELIVEVRDNGTGMEEKIRQRCLEPFFSTKAQRGGTGLGLAMVYGMMQRHEGNIEIESAPGHGTCIRLVFPIRESNSHASKKTAPVARPGHSLNLLCIDDEPQIRDLLKACLTAFHHHVSVASGGKEGLAMFHAARLRHEPYHVVITDLGMPELDGHHVARAIKEESPNIPVIMMTGWGTMMKDNGETAPEVDAVIGKPPNLPELNALLTLLTAAAKA